MTDACPGGYTQCTQRQLSMDRSMNDHQIRLEDVQAAKLMLAMPLTTVLKVLRDWRYVALMVSKLIFQGRLRGQWFPQR